jgi:S-adenosylmethionine:tRNA ribosyltransferase-isomerase
MRTNAAMISNAGKLEKMRYKSLWIYPMTALSQFDYELPERLIAYHPLAQRRASRLMALRRGDESPRHKSFPDILDFLNPGDALVVNHTRVRKCRLHGKRKDTGGNVSFLLLTPQSDNGYHTLVQSRRPLGAGTIIEFASNITATIQGRLTPQDSVFLVHFSTDIAPHLDTLGEIPLPGYINRTIEASDSERYQTVYSQGQEPSAAAAPTAGLHFDEALLAEIRAKGIHVVEVDLVVGPGTFFPVKSEHIEDHVMHRERYEMSAKAASTLNAVKAAGGRVIAVGTTSVRVLESVALKTADTQNREVFASSSGETDLFIKPGFRFRAIDGLITNFHQPRSTLFVMICALLGRERALAAYNEAIAKEYRFFSYGDACYFDVAARVEQTDET